MQYLLSAACRPLLRQLASERTLCAFDFDGTLAPIVAHPDLVGMRQRTRVLLTRLAERYPCVIISGRARADVAARIEGVPVTRVIGNHGGETETNTGEIRDRIREWQLLLERTLGTEAGIWVENKGHSLAIHYRQYPRKLEARRRILAVTQALAGAHVIGGKKVVNLMESGSPTKGAALAAERARLQCDWVLFVGDDANDEDAFALDGNIVAVRVGRKESSKAGYYLRTQSELDELLEMLGDLREPPPVQPGVPAASGPHWP